MDGTGFTSPGRIAFFQSHDCSDVDLVCRLVSGSLLFVVISIVHFRKLCGYC